METLVVWYPLTALQTTAFIINIFLVQTKQRQTKMWSFSLKYKVLTKNSIPNPNYVEIIQGDIRWKEISLL